MVWSVYLSKMEEQGNKRKNDYDVGQLTRRKALA